MEDVSLRHDFHRALDAVAPPAPWLRSRVFDELDRKRGAGVARRSRRRPFDNPWLLPLVAVLIALAIIVSLVVGSHLLTPRPVPVKPSSGSAAACPEWGYIPGGAGAPSAIKMMSATTGWAPGDLRTTDGGAHWQDVSPKDLRADEPYLPGQKTAYPPNYNDFFLDADHAWLTRTYPSDQRCIDHVSTFGTSNGGRTWSQSTAVVPHLATADRPHLVITFQDAKHGWLLVSSPPKVALLFGSNDGGQSWKLLTNHGPLCPAIVFVSSQAGWSGCGGPNVGGNGLSFTRDGGVTWSQVGMASTSLPVFFDAAHAAALVGTDNGEAIYETADGGNTWQTVTFTMPGGFEPYPVAVDFAAWHDFWIFVTPPGWFKGGTPTDWLYHSADGGASWQLVQQDTPVSFATTLDFVSASEGFVLQQDSNNGPPQILFTTDGGHTWSTRQPKVAVQVPTVTSPLVAKTGLPSHGSVYFASRSVAWELTIPPDRQSTVVLRSSDGGAHWRVWGIAPVAAPPLAFGTDEVVLNDSSKLIVSSDGARWSTRPLPVDGSVSMLPDLQHAWAYGAFPLSPSAAPPAKGGPPSVMGVWSTADGGVSWHLQARGYIGDGSGFITFWSSTTGAVLQGGSAWLSSDAGVTWRQMQLAQIPADSFALDGGPTMFDANHGIITLMVGNSATYVSRTSDGGRTWSTADLAARGCITCGGSLAFFDSNRWITLNQGILLSSDGGQSWAAVTTTNPGKDSSGIELIPGQPGAAVVFAPGVFASETTDGGAHWRAIALPELPAGYSGFAGSGGWRDLRSGAL